MCEQDDTLKEAHTSSSSPMQRVVVVAVLLASELDVRLEVVAEVVLVLVLLLLLLLVLLVRLVETEVELVVAVPEVLECDVMLAAVKVGLAVGAPVGTHLPHSAGQLVCTAAWENAAPDVQPSAV